VIERFRGLPVLLWCYHPLKTLPDHMGMNDQFRLGGVVGAMQTSAPLRKLDVKLHFIFGTPGDPVLDREFKEYGKAFAAVMNMRSLRLGQIGGRYEEMTGTYADEFFLLGKLGVELVPLSAQKLYQAAQSISDAQIDEYLLWLKARCVSIGVSEKALRYAARASLAVGRLSREEGLGALALEDFNQEMHDLLGTRPQLWVPELDDLKLVPSMEGDVLAALALWISRQLGETMPFYTEIFTFDQARNSILMGHASMNCLDLAGDNPISIIPDAETGTLDAVEGAWIHFACKPGPVTVASLFDIGGGAYRAAVFTGEGQYSELLGMAPNILVKLPIPLDRFFKIVITAGMTQHLALSYDDIARSWEKFCKIAGIDFLDIV